MTPENRNKAIKIEEKYLAELKWEKVRVQESIAITLARLKHLKRNIKKGDTNDTRTED